MASSVHERLEVDDLPSDGRGMGSDSAEARDRHGRVADPTQREGTPDRDNPSGMVHPDANDLIG
jgi:hypothetical protein